MSYVSLTVFCARPIVSKSLEILFLCRCDVGDFPFPKKPPWLEDFPNAVAAVLKQKADGRVYRVYISLYLIIFCLTLQSHNSRVRQLCHSLFTYFFDAAAATFDGNWTNIFPSDELIVLFPLYEVWNIVCQNLINLMFWSVSFGHLKTTFLMPVVLSYVQ